MPPCNIWNTFRMKEDPSNPPKTFPAVEEWDNLREISKTFYYPDWRPLPPLPVYTAIRKYVVTILSSMTEVKFFLVEPASLCRAAGEDSNLMWFSSAAEIKLQLKEAFCSSLRWDWVLWTKLPELFRALCQVLPIPCNWEYLCTGDPYYVPYTLLLIS
jgi:hypothetical protein